MTDITISFEYASVWLKLLCIIAGLTYASVLYYKSSLFNETAVWMIRLMAVLRFIAVSVLAFLLLNPLLKTLLREIEKPIIVFVQDNSESILLTQNSNASAYDSTFYFNEYPLKISQLIKKLEDDFIVRQYSFGNNFYDGINFKFNEKQTDIASVVEEISSRFDNRNIGAVVLASDGIYNKGINPVYAASKVKVPLFTIALGDTSIRRDLVLVKANHNKLAYLGNKFPLEIIIEAKKCIKNKTVLTITKDSSIIHSQTIDINEDMFLLKIPHLLEAKEKGIQHYKVILSTVEGEINTKNNFKDIFIDILDSRQKILLLANAPHPDISAIKYAIESNQNYETNTLLARDMNWNSNDSLSNLKKYNLVVLYQLPSHTQQISNVLSVLNQEKIPVLYVLGTQSSIPLFNNLQTGVTIMNSRNNFNEVQANVSRDFTPFSISEDTENKIEEFPPLTAPFGIYQSSELNSCLLYQQIGVVKTIYPLLVFNEEEGKRTGMLMGEGIWKWKLYEYSNHYRYTAMNELITKIIQFLSAKSDKRYFRIVNSQNTFLENEPVQFEVEVYNKSYELINKPDIKINIISSKGKVFPFNFSRTDNAYVLDAGKFEVGEYKYEASVQVGKDIFKITGEFSVSEVQEEARQTVADHQLLYYMAANNDGEMFYPDQLNLLADKLKEREDIKAIVYTKKSLREIINFPEVLIGLLFLLSLEWFIRKREGRV